MVARCVRACVRACVRVCVCESNQSIFYFMSVHIEVILDKKKKSKNIIIIYTNFPTGL